MELINTNKYIKVLKDNGIMDAIDREKDRGYSNIEKELLEDNVLIGIILYFYIISGTKGELAREALAKIKHIKLLRDCTRWDNQSVINLRTAKALIDSFLEFGFIVDGKKAARYIKTDIRDIGICLRDELLECYNGNIETLIAKFMLLNDNDNVKAYLFSRK